MTKFFCFLLIFVSVSGDLLSIPADLFFFDLERKAAAGEDNREARGVCLLYGYGTPVRLAAARKCLQNMVPADSCGAPFFMEFQGMDDAALYQLAEKEAENLSVPAMRIAAFCCLYGRGTKKNHLKAMSYYRRAAAAGDPVSAAFLYQLTGEEEWYEKSVRLTKAMKAFPKAYFPVLTEEKDDECLIIEEKESVAVFLSRLLLHWKSGRQVRIFMTE